ncbi:uncharacterized protein [Glycine max]|uniref:uncharacterized protein n=1 Tax=Glycine max TaxID=3847 RepID=UPI0003DEB286|nr:uncharacterized protein LOC112998711 [Glycine max]|eukprot:XP_025980621.1 uncharacterized protein LOC112998711 [Glycine max]
MIVAEYAAKFEELVRYFPYYQGRDGESSKCVKFLNGLRLEVKQAVNYQGVRQFPLLVNICRISDEDSRDRATYYRSTGPIRDKKNGPQHRGKPYSNPPKQYGNRHDNQTTVARGIAGGSGSKPNTFPTQITCYRCKKPGHISSNFPDKEIPTSGSVLTSDVCMDCLVEISGRTFLIDLICLPLSQIEVILGMDWLSSNHVLLNYFDKTVAFDDSRGSKDMMFISANQVKTSLKEDAQVYLILSSLKTKTMISMCDLPVVREFPEVFPEDIYGLPPERDKVFHRPSTWCWAHIHSPL